jgi:hypothetical protein
MMESDAALEITPSSPSGAPDDSQWGLAIVFRSPPDVIESVRSTARLTFY